MESNHKFHHIDFMSRQQEKIKELVERRAAARQGGGQKRIDAQHQKGKLTARERLALLLDEGSFEEFDMFVQHRCTNFGMDKIKYDGDGVVTGMGTIDGRLVYVSAQDFTVTGGSMSETMAMKISKVMDMAVRNGVPFIGINDSGGARIQEGICSLAGYGEIFERNILASGVIPQISGIFGPCAGGAVYSPALTDFTFMEAAKAKLFVNSPNAIAGNEVSKCDTASAKFQMEEVGIVDVVAEEAELMAQIRELVCLLPANNEEDGAFDECTDDLNRVCADLENAAGDPAIVLSNISDDAVFFVDSNIVWFDCIR